jgi:hypothetical protein
MWLLYSVVCGEHGMLTRYTVSVFGLDVKYFNSARIGGVRRAESSVERTGAVSVEWKR